MDSLTPQIPAALRQTASSSRILLSFLVGFLILLLPWHGMGLWFRPDLLGLLIIYWGVYEPYAVGTGTAFLLGFLMDFAESHVFGIHGLTYSLLYFFDSVLPRTHPVVLPSQSDATRLGTAGSQPMG